jgi:hypothetical protein
MASAPSFASASSISFFLSAFFLCMASCWIFRSSFCTSWATFCRAASVLDRAWIIYSACESVKDQT